MKPSQIRIAVSKTVNLGNFNSIKVEADMTAPVGEDENLADVKADLQAELRTALDETYRAHLRSIQQ